MDYFNGRLKTAQLSGETRKLPVTGMPPVRWMSTTRRSPGVLWTVGDAPVTCQRVRSPLGVAPVMEGRSSTSASVGFMMPMVKGIFFHHSHSASIADNLPRRSADNWESRVLKALVRRVAGRDREVELAVFEHLRPNAAVDAPPEMLDPLGRTPSDPFIPAFQIEGTTAEADAAQPAVVRANEIAQLPADQGPCRSNRVTRATLLPGREASQVQQSPAGIVQSRKNIYKPMVRASQPFHFFMASRRCC